MGGVKVGSPNRPLAHDERYEAEDSRPIYVPILSAASAFLMILAVILTDILWGQHYGVLLFYLVPIAWAGWQAGTVLTVVVTIFAALGRFAVQIVADFNSGRPLSESIWESLTQFVFFMVFAGLILKVNNQLQQERSLARSDSLTRLLNARAFEEALNFERERLRRYKRSFTLIYLDLDNFKAVNDRWGHAAGDELLKTIARTLIGNIREVDCAARLGGDEFAILLPETDEPGASIVLERLRARMLSAVEARGWPVTCSIGSVTFYQAPNSIDAVVQQADAAMYRAKRRGKNCVEAVVYDPLIAA